MGNHTPGPWQWEYNPSSKSVSLVGGKPMFDKTVMDFARWGMNRATPMFNEAITDPHGWHIITRLCDRPDWLAPIPGREHHKDWCMQVTHPDAMLMARAPELLKENERLRAEVEALRDANERLNVAVAEAERIVRAYARRNPRHEYKGVIQDPFGAHGWLDRFDAARAAREGRG